MRTTLPARRLASSMHRTVDVASTTAAAACTARRFATFTSTAPLHRAPVACTTSAALHRAQPVLPVMAHIPETQRPRSFASSGCGHAGAGLLRRTRLLLGYSFFEDQFPKEKPAERFAYYEDQMAAATAKNMEPKPHKSEHERLVDLHDWKKTEKELNIPENFGWAEEWGPEPGEEGHNDWYKKERQYMSEEEKLKFDIGLGVPLKSKHIRHQELPYHRKVAASYYNLNEDKPYHYTTKDKNVDAPYTPQEKSDYMGSARRDFLEEWLAKPGVNPENVGMKVAEYNGTAKNHAVKKLPRKPDWELAPQTDDDE